MTDLSPTAQAVLEAAFAQDHPYDHPSLAAALRAAVEKTKKRQYGTCWVCDANELLAIAAELE